MVQYCGAYRPVVGKPVDFGIEEAVHAVIKRHGQAGRSIGPWNLPEARDVEQESNAVIVMNDVIDLDVALVTWTLQTSGVGDVIILDVSDCSRSSSAIGQNGLAVWKHLAGKRAEARLRNLIARKWIAREAASVWIGDGRTGIVDLQRSPCIYPL